jgi:type IV pilus assembly protein PilA
MKPTSRGFTLIELMIVVAIIGVIAAIALPNLIEARKASNEASAIAGLRTLHAAEEMYRDQDKDHDGRLQFATSLAVLRNTNALIDNALASGSKQGYLFTITTADEYHFEATASPIAPGRSGDRYFLIDDSGVIRFSTSATITSTSPAVGG